MNRTQIGRFVLAASVFLTVGSHSSWAAGTGSGTGTGTVRAVSLSVLQKQAQACRGALPQTLAQLAGLNTIWGYIVDEENKDIILYGAAQERRTNTLYLEDLSVAFRNAWMKYAELNGNTYTYSYPGCSIDPDPATMRKLNEIGRAAGSDRKPGLVEEDLNQWRTVCEQWQQVRVLGVPFNSRFGAAMVKADYDMKVLVDGTDRLDIPGFNSLIGMKMCLVEDAVASRQPISVSLAGMNRFWFYPGPNRYEEDDGIVWIKDCPVVLLTEEMALGRKGGYGSAGSIDPLAEKFAKDFSNLYARVAEERPIYTDLENLFRFVALVKVINFKEGTQNSGLNIAPRLTAGLDLRCLLDELPIQPISVAKQLRGRSAIKEFKHTEESAAQRTIYQLWLQSCGGVDIKIDVVKGQFTGPSPLLRRMKRAILAARPSPAALFWDLPADSDAVMEIRNAMNLAALGSGTYRRSTVLVQRKESNYCLFTEKGRIYQGDAVSGIATALQASGTLNGGYLTVETSGFAEKESAAFRVALRLQIQKVDGDVSLSYVTEGSGEAGLYAAVASPGAALDPLSQRTDTNLKQGSQTMTLHFRVRGMARNQGCVVEIVSERAEWTGAVVRALFGRLGPYGASSESLVDCTHAERDRVSKNLGLRNKNIQIRIRNESGVIEIGGVLRAIGPQPT